MRQGLKELIGLTTILVLAFLVLTHATGFARDISALGSNYAHVVKVFQGR